MIAHYVGSTTSHIVGTRIPPLPLSVSVSVCFLYSDPSLPRWAPVSVQPTATMPEVKVPNDIIVFQYPFSPYARRVLWYLELRGIPYAQCVSHFSLLFLLILRALNTLKIQPPRLPRPDLAALGVRYRRIPLMAIGRDIYLDSRLILSTLDSHPSLSSYKPLSTPQSAGIAMLFDKFSTDSGVFTRAAQLIPLESKIWEDEKFQKDREDMTGRSWRKADVAKARPEALAHMRLAFEAVEAMLNDGREWIAATREVSLADVEAVWVFDWLLDMKTLPSDLISADFFPKTYAWIHRFREALRTARSRNSKPVNLAGSDAVAHVASASFNATEALAVVPVDPLRLKEGDEVEVWPIDSGSRHRDRGRLINLTHDKVVIEVENGIGEKMVRVHAPRWGFRIAKAGAGEGAKL